MGARRKNILLRFGWEVHTTDIQIRADLKRRDYNPFDGGYLAYVEGNNIQDFKNEFFHEMDYLRSLSIITNDFSISEIMVAVDESGEILGTRHFEL